MKERPELQPGQAFGGFRIERELGRGAMGVVYRAVQLNLNRPIALKVFPVETDRASETYIDRFINEARAAASLGHPNIVQVYDTGCTEGYFYFAMELVNGENLLQVLEKYGRFSPQRVFNVALPLIDALSYGWSEMRLVHGDIKPENIMIDGSGRVKLTDFGLAKIRTHGDEDGMPCLMTPAYAAPEILTGKSAPCCASDIYAFGATLYHLLAGVPMFEHEDSMEIMKLQVSTDPVPLVDRIPEFPQTLSDFVAALLAKDPSFRPTSWLEVRMGLYGAMSSVIPGMDIPVSVPKIARPVQIEPPPPQPPPMAVAPALPTEEEPVSKPHGAVSRPVFMAIFYLCVIMSLAVVGLAWRLYVVENQLQGLNEELTKLSTLPSPDKSIKRPEQTAPPPETTPGAVPGTTTVTPPQTTPGAAPGTTTVTPPQTTPGATPGTTPGAAPGTTTVTPPETTSGAAGTATVPATTPAPTATTLVRTVRDIAIDQSWTLHHEFLLIGPGHANKTTLIDFDRLGKYQSRLQTYLKRYRDEASTLPEYQNCERLAVATQGCLDLPKELADNWARKPIHLSPEQAELLFPKDIGVDFGNVMVGSLDQGRGVSLEYSLAGGDNGSTRLRRQISWASLPEPVLYSIVTVCLGGPRGELPSPGLLGLQLLHNSNDRAVWSQIWKGTTSAEGKKAMQSWEQLRLALINTDLEMKSYDSLQGFSKALAEEDRNQAKAAAKEFLAGQGEMVSRYRSRIKAIVQSLPEAGEEPQEPKENPEATKAP